MNIKTFLGLTAVGTLCLACQSNIYQIDGFARDFKDGDTICLRHDSENDKLILITQVTDGRFSFSGETDTVAFCHVYAKKHPERTVSFFLESARITIELSLAAERNRVSGTTINNTWQQLNDSIRQLGQETVRTALLPIADSVTQQQRVKKIDSLHRRMSDYIINISHRNSGNPLGRYIEKNYKAPGF